MAQVKIGLGSGRALDAALRSVSAGAGFARLPLTIVFLQVVTVRRRNAGNIVEVVDDIVRVGDIGFPAVLVIKVVAVAVIVGFDDRRSRNTIGPETVG